MSLCPSEVPPAPGPKYKMKSEGLRDKARKQRAHNGILPCLELDNSPMTSWWAVDYSVGGKGSGASPVDFTPSFAKRCCEHLAHTWSVTLGSQRHINAFRSLSGCC